MPKYIYECPSCGNDYSECRLATQPQIFTKCDVCNDAEYVEISQEPL